MAEHTNMKGYHQQVRPHRWHHNEGYIKKVVRGLSPIEMYLSTSDDELQETMVVEMGCVDSGMWYVDTAGCGMQQANDAEPPPKHGWLHKALQCAAVFMVGLMLLTGPTSCVKDPIPTPDPTEIPNDSSSSDTSHVHGDTTIPYSGNVAEFYYTGGDNFPSLQEIRECLARGDSSTIYWSACSDLWTAFGTHAACDSFAERFKLQDEFFPPRMGARGTVLFDKIVRDEDSVSRNVRGASRDVVNRFRGWGYVVKLCEPDTCKKVNNDSGVGSAVIEDKRMRAMNDQRRYWSNNLGRKMTSNQY